MGYISYFDLLGTRGFCQDPQVYYSNICKFNSAVKQAAWLLADYGNVGIFSDSAYAESTDLKSLLEFLIILRDRLMSEELFFNAVIKKGELGIQPINGENITFGVALNNSSIADLYISQTNFKGVGINIDSNDELLEEIRMLGDEGFPYTLSNCIYMARDTSNGDQFYRAVSYHDVSLSKPRYVRAEADSLDILLRTFYSSYVKSPKFGAYYISCFSNLLRSSSKNFEWDMREDEFTNMPIAFRTVWKMLNTNQLEDLPGLDNLAFVFIDEVFNSDDLNEEEKAGITKKMLEMNSMKKYRHALNSIPTAGLTDNKLFNINNRDLFIRFCQEDLSTKFADDILS